MSQEPTSFIKPLPPPQMLFVTQLREGRWPVPVPAPAMALCNALAGGRQWLHVGRCSHPATSAAHPTHFVRDALSAHAIVTSASGLFLYHFCCSKVTCAPCCRLSGRLRMSASALWVYNHGVHGRWYRRLCVLPDHTPIPTGARLFTTARPSHLSSVCVVFWDPLAPEGPRWQLGAGGGGRRNKANVGRLRPCPLPPPHTQQALGRWTTGLMGFQQYRWCTGAGAACRRSAHGRPSPFKITRVPTLRRGAPGPRRDAFP